MIGNQAINGIMEMLIPFLTKLYNTFKVTTGLQKVIKEEITLISCNQWTEDYKLSEFQSRSLFFEYLEMGKKCSVLIAKMYLLLFFQFYNMDLLQFLSQLFL